MYNGPFHLYFAGTGGAPSQEEIKRLQCNQLLSYRICKRDAYKWIDYKREHPEYAGKLFIDSGAHSLSTGKIQVDAKTYLDGYIDFINETGDAGDIYAELDVIHDNHDGSVIEDSVDQSWDNYLYMVSKVKLEYRDKILPVFHFNEDFSGLDRMLNYVHPDTGKHIPYIGLAPRFGNASARNSWLTEAFNHIARSTNPDVMTHAFGCTILSLLEQFPLTSADSATWAIASAYGNIRIGDSSVCISDRTTLKNTNTAQKNPAYQEAVEAAVAKHGFTLDEVMEDSEKRKVLTIRELRSWELNYKCKYKPLTKTCLW